MSEQTASRTLVKSTPELWAALSDPVSLAQHLGDFGEIRITRLEAESSVAWEGERARGTIELEPSGWGTRVTLTATPAAVAAAVELTAPPPPPPSPTVSAAAPPATPPARGDGGLLNRVLRALVGSQRSQSAAEQPAAAAGPAPTPAPAPAPAPAPQAATVAPAPQAGTVAPEHALAVLTGALDALGGANRRPFSRD